MLSCGSVPYLVSDAALPFPGPSARVTSGPVLQVSIPESGAQLGHDLVRFAASRGLPLSILVSEDRVPVLELPTVFTSGQDAARQALALELVSLISAGEGSDTSGVSGTFVEKQEGHPRSSGECSALQKAPERQRTVNFTLGLDLDGVCGDYISEFRRFVSRSLEVPESELPDPKVWDFTDAGWGIESVDHFKELHADAVRDGMFRSMPAMPGISEALWELSDAGVFIRIITHRLVVNKLHAIAAADTVTWLDRHDIPFRDLCFVGAKAQVDADVYIDDAPHNVIALASSGKDVIVFDASYNREIIDPDTGIDYSDLPRVYNWAQARDAILARKEAWDLAPV